MGEPAFCISKQQRQYQPSHRHNLLSNFVVYLLNTVKPSLSDHIKQYIFLAFQTGDCLLLHESSAESSCMSFLQFFHPAISNHLSIAISVSPEWMVAKNRFNCSRVDTMEIASAVAQIGFVLSDQILLFLDM